MAKLVKAVVNVNPDEIVHTVRTKDGQKQKIKGKELKKIACEYDYSTGERCLSYDLDYIRNWIRTDQYIFDLRHWPDRKFSEEALKKWWDSDFTEPKDMMAYAGHFHYIVGNWKYSGGAWEEFLKLFLEVKEKHLKSLYDSFYRSMKYETRVVFEYSIKDDDQWVTGWIDHVRTSVKDLNDIADALGWHHVALPKWIDRPLLHIKAWKIGEQIKKLLDAKKLMVRELNRANRMGENYDSCYFRVPHSYPTFGAEHWLYCADVEDLQESMKKIDELVKMFKGRMLKLIYKKDYELKEKEAEAKKKDAEAKLAQNLKAYALLGKLISR